MQYYFNSLLLASSVTGYLLPNPPGRYNVTLTTGPLSDHTRKLSSTGGPRTLMLSVFEPAICKSTISAQYMPDKTARFQGAFLESIFNITFDFTQLFQAAELPVCVAKKCSRPDDSPILLFSPGYAIPRVYYSYLVAAVASEGFTVISIDHPEDANIITYPDGSTIYNDQATNFTDAIFEAYLPPRVTDMSFVIDQLSNATAMAALLPHRGKRAFRTDRIAVFGQSLGGAAAIIAASEDKRVRGAINWDGSVFTSLPAAGLSKPVMILQHPSNESDATLDKLWPELSGPKLWLNIANTFHYTFSDAPTLLQAAGQDITPFADILGTISPTEMVNILTSYTTAWMRGVFSNKIGGPLLDGATRFPEVSVLSKANF